MPTGRVPLLCTPPFLVFLSAALPLASHGAQGAIETINDVALQQRFVKQMQDDGVVERTLPPTEIARILAEPSGPPAKLGDVSAAVMAKSRSVYRDCKPAVVAIGSPYKCGGCPDWHANFASGWLASPQGHVVTNHHVLAKRQTPSAVMTADGAVYPIVEICTFDAASDVLVMRIDTGGQAVPFLRLAEDVSTGDEIAIISHPGNRLWYFSRGVVSRMFQRGPDLASPIWTSISADFGIGSSGAPVLNDRGEVVAMATFTNTLFTEDKKEPQMTERSCTSLSALQRLLTGE